MRVLDGSKSSIISIHALLAESDVGASQGADSEHISIHALLAESDLPQSFLSYLPMDFYPRSPCGERQGYFARNAAAIRISIHALLAESDSQK